MADAPAAAQQLFETADSDEAGQYLTDLFGANIRLGAQRKGFLLRLSQTGTDALAITTATQTDQITYTHEPPPALTISRLRTATVNYRCAGAEHRFGPGDVFLSNPAEGGAPFRVRLGGGTAQTIAIPLSSLDHVADTAETHDPTPIRFTERTPITPSAARQLTATIDYLADAFRDQPQSIAQPLVAGAAGQLLAAIVLCAFPNTALVDPTIEDRHDAHPRTLRRAVAFIDDYAYQDITTADVAAAVHVTIRALQYAFRRHLATTPTGYLRHVRLHHAHQELLATDPTTGATVTEIAARWGFFHSGRFAHYYRQVYGQSPYQTLSRDPR
jgi:AraC-like DNA-binding protein